MKLTRKIYLYTQQPETTEHEDIILVDNTDVFTTRKTFDTFNVSINNNGECLFKNGITRNKLQEFLYDLANKSPTDLYFQLRTDGKIWHIPKSC